MPLRHYADYYAAIIITPLLPLHYAITPLIHIDALILIIFIDTLTLRFHYLAISLRLFIDIDAIIFITPLLLIYFDDAIRHYAITPLILRHYYFDYISHYFISF
jgi:hypothetical protein